MKLAVAAAAAANQDSSEPLRVITHEELKKHTKSSDCWVVSHGKVYDVTHYLEDHPGGYQLLFRHAGGDCTADFEAMYHSKRARKILDGMVVGILEGNGPQFLNPKTIPRGGGYPWNNKPEQPTPTTAPTLLKSQSSQVGTPKPDLTKFYPITLSSIEKLNSDTSIFNFTVPSSEDANALLHFSPSSHIDLRYMITLDGEQVNVLRSYTPIGADTVKRELNILIKRYDTGFLSEAIHKLKIGDKVDVRGPIQTFVYKEGTYDTLVMLAAGTGITPMLQIAKAALANPTDKTELVLLFANKTPADILLRKELEDTASGFTNRFTLIHLLSRADEGWNLLKGHISADIINKVVPPVGSKNVKILMCGPKGFVDLSTSLLKDYGYSSDQLFAF